MNGYRKVPLKKADEMEADDNSNSSDDEIPGPADDAEQAPDNGSNGAQNSESDREAEDESQASKEELSGGFLPNIPLHIRSRREWWRGRRDWRKRVSSKEDADIGKNRIFGKRLREMIEKSFHGHFTPIFSNTFLICSLSINPSCRKTSLIL